MLAPERVIPYSSVKGITMPPNEQLKAPIRITDTFPNLGVVNRQLYPETVSQRPSIGQYTAALEAQGHLTPAVAESIEKAKAIRESTSCVVYIAGPLTGVSGKLKERYGAVSNMLATYESVSADKPQTMFGYVPHLHGTDPVKHPDVTAQEVRDIDFLWAGVVADVHVNFLDPMAHGNAIEEGWAESRLIPTVYLNPKGNRLSRLTLGMHNAAHKIEYSNFQTEAVDENEFITGTLKGMRETTQSGLAKLRVNFDELHTWLQAFPGRDPREFHYTSFPRLANPTTRAAGLDPKKGYGMEELVETFDPQSFIVYVKNPLDTNYGKLGRIDSANDYTGLIVTMQDGSTRLYDPFIAGSSLSLWPVEPSSSKALELAMVKASELPDPE